MISTSLYLLFARDFVSTQFPYLNILYHSIKETSKFGLIAVFNPTSTLFHKFHITFSVVAIKTPVSIFLQFSYRFNFLSFLAKLNMIIMA